MARGYQPETIETKWQERWEAGHAFRAGDIEDKRPKKYILDMFPYPSGKGLHLGHVENYAISDVMARYARQRGFNVLHPMGWDAFGLPAEQYAIEHQVHPREAVQRNVDVFRAQMQRLGFSYDWSREIDSTDPDYYRWTQWIFLKLREKGLAYVDEVPVNWCEGLGTVLANEEVIDGLSERGSHPVVRKPMRQWLLRITEYADRLLEDLDDLEWPEHLKKMQREWIGKSIGTEVDFRIDEKRSFTVFTTRPDTLFGATFCVLAPEHPLVQEITTTQERAAVEAYIEKTARRSERDRITETRAKSGVFTGAFATNPVNGEQVPIWIADYVLASYGTGSVMAVPGHDQRDYEFARGFDLPVVEVVSGGDITQAAHEGDGTLVGSGLLDGLDVSSAKERITSWLEAEGLGRARVQYRLRDWLFSRQRYWGEPFPILYREDGSIVEVQEADLPVRLPEVESYKPTGTGESPLAAVAEWVNTTDPADGAPARRETNTMPQWAGSCWYYLRFADPHNQGAFCSEENDAYWLPVDTYVGGAEHAVLHLLYARFWHKVLYDLGLVHTKEPFRRLVNQGMILAPSYRVGGPRGRYVSADDLDFRDGAPVLKDGVLKDGAVKDGAHQESDEEVYSVVEKMGKSKKNVVNPDDIVTDLGADTVRLYILFMGPPEGDKLWDASGIQGVNRFLHKAWRLICGDERTEARTRSQAPAVGQARHALHAAIAGVTADMESLGYNTAISKLMVLLNAMADSTPLPAEMVDGFLRMLSPFAPHIAEEMWEACGRKGFVSNVAWPTHEEDALQMASNDYAVQVNGKVRGHVTLAAGAGDEEVLQAAKALENVALHLDGKSLVKQMVVQDRLVVLVAR